MKITDAEVLRALREKLGLTVAELAAEIGLPAPLIEGWEAGTTKPRAGLWRALCELLACRGVVSLETAAAAADRRQRSREEARGGQIAALAAELNAALPPRRRRRKSEPPPGGR